VRFRDSSGKTHERLFVSECQTGIGGSVVEGIGGAHKRFGGTLAFGSMAILLAVGYKAVPMSVRVGNSEKIHERLMGVVVGNGSRCGGGMSLTPAARLDDGEFDVLLIHDMTLLQRLWSFPKIYSGRHVESPHFSIHRGAKVVVDSGEPVPVEADGELLGVPPCEIEVLPAALQVRCSRPRGAET
jgi:diacylglycerol kinase family enzyme